MHWTQIHYGPTVCYKATIGILFSKLLFPSWFNQECLWQRTNNVHSNFERIASFWSPRKIKLWKRMTSRGIKSLWFILCTHPRSHNKHSHRHSASIITNLSLVACTQTTHWKRFPHTSHSMSASEWIGLSSHLVLLDLYKEAKMLQQWNNQKRNC